MAQEKQWISCTILPDNLLDILNLSQDEDIALTKANEKSMEDFFQLEKYNKQKNQWESFEDKQRPGKVMACWIEKKDKRQILIHILFYKYQLNEREIKDKLSYEIKVFHLKIVYDSLLKRVGSSLEKEITTKYDFTQFAHHYGAVESCIHIMGFAGNLRFTFAPEFPSNSTWFPQSTALVYVPKHICFYLMGGRDIAYNNPIGIWRFEIKDTDKPTSWTKLKDIKFPLCDVALALTPDGNDIIIAGGKEMVQFCDGKYAWVGSNKVYKLDLRNTDKLQLKECKQILLPSYGKCYINITGNPITNGFLIYGWIRALWDRSEFRKLRLPPEYLIKIIADFYNEQWMYWSTNINRHHAKKCIQKWE